jgi:cell division protein FtsB
MPREKPIQDRQVQLLDELEDIVSLLAQQTDSKTTNLQVHIEQQKKLLDEQDKRRWRWFAVLTTSVLLAIGVLTFEMWERQYDRINSVEKQIVKTDTSVEALKDNIMKKYEFREQLEDHRKKAEEDRDKKDKDLEDRIKVLEKELLRKK